MSVRARVPTRETLTLKTNLSYSIKLLNTNYTLCYYDNTSLQDVYYNDISTVLNFTEDKYINYFVFNNSTSLYKLSDEKQKDVTDIFPNVASKMDSLITSYYHSTKYLYYNNKK